jgi:hypothetical protein
MNPESIFEDNTSIESYSSLNNDKAIIIEERLYIPIKIESRKAEVR